MILSTAASPAHRIPIPVEASTMRMVLFVSRRLPLKLLPSRLLLVLVCALSVRELGAEQATGKLDFNRDIRPILSKHCFRCHGPDEAERGGGGPHGLRLDTREGLLADLDGHTAVVPGQPDESHLMLRVTSQDESVVMPPPTAGQKLATNELALLRRWIEEGANYSQHWSYVIPQRPAVPPLPDALSQAWARNPIDHYIGQRLAQEALVPQPEADRYALVRRVSLDATGIPPTWNQVQQFVNDPAPDAYERMVDRTLASETYGEHWARMWLDLARYADSAGYADDPARNIWAYRDYVIEAFNRNMPFDQFTIEQIAGDQLPHPTTSQWIATAFHRNTLTNNEGGTNDEEFRNVAIVDRVNTTYAVWMGTTMTCAQCHTHKYDPLTQTEFFQSFAIFNNTEDADRGDESPLHEVWTESQLQRRQQLQQALQENESILQQMTPSLEASFRIWEAALHAPQWKSPSIVSAVSAEGTTLTIDPEAQVIRSTGDAINDQFAITLDLAAGAGTDGQDLQAVQIEALADPSLPSQGPGWSDGNFVLSEVRATLVPPQATPPAGKYVRIELPGEQRILSLAEVEVFSAGQNVAPQGIATQSSTAFEGVAQRAIDGLTQGDYFQSKSVTHSEIDSVHPWWEVELKEQRPIERIVVWNRTDGGPAIGERLKGALIKLLDAQRQVVWEGQITETSTPEVAWSLDGSRTIPFAAAWADYSQEGFPAANLVAQPMAARSGWAVGGALGRDHRLTLVASAAIPIIPGSQLRVELLHRSPHARHLLGKFRVQISSDPQVSVWAAMPPEIQRILLNPATERTPEQHLALAGYYRTIAPELADVRQRVQTIKTELATLKPMTTVPVMRDLPETQQRVTRIQNRGNFLDLGDTVTPGIPAVFQMPGQAVVDRLALARWLVSRDNPLTARVTVNRYWEQLFGTGLVATAEEFGSQGDLPTHPELLDWLAVEFMDSGWDMKQLLRTMLLSATYRQSSHVSPELAQRDPDNRLLARGPRFRLPAETIRDQALSIAGLLSHRKFGPPVKPPQPSLGLAAAFGSSTDWQTSLGEDRYRRGIYTTLRRSNPYPSMSTFDAPNREVCTLRRVRTNTPLQALVTLNDPVYIEAAQSLAKTLLAQPGTLTQKLEFALSRALARPAAADEVDVLQQLYDKAYQVFKEQPAEAHQLVNVSDAAQQEPNHVIEWAAGTVVANAILNLDEFLMRR